VALGGFQGLLVDEQATSVSSVVSSTLTSRVRALTLFSPSAA
jgi:hypothetical protein